MPLHFHEFLLKSTQGKVFAICSKINPNSTNRASPLSPTLGAVFLQLPSKPRRRDVPRNSLEKHWVIKHDFAHANINLFVSWISEPCSFSNWTPQSARFPSELPSPSSRLHQFLVVLQKVFCFFFHMEVQSYHQCSRNNFCHVEQSIV